MRRLLLATALSTGLIACVVRPGPAPQNRQLEASAVGLSAGPPLPPIAARWWEAFGDQQLNHLVERATRDNPALADALARLQHAQALLQAESSGLVPRLDATGSELRERFSERYVIPPPYGGSSVWNGQLNLGLTWNLDFWGRQREQVHASERYSYAAELDASAARLAIQSAVVSTYLELDRAHSLLDLAQQTESNRAQLADLTRRRVTAGIDTNAELQNAAAPVPEARVDIAHAQARIQLLVHALAAISGQGTEAYRQIGPPTLALAALPSLPAVLPGDLLTRRADVQAALARVQAADATAEAARLATYPDINLAAFVGTAALTLADLLSAPARTYGVGPGISLPLFDAGLLSARHQSATAALDSAIAQYNRAVLSAVREAGDALSLVMALGSARAEASQRLDHLSQAERLAEERFQAGIAAEQGVLDARSRVLTARTALVSIRTLEAQARVSLLVALGGSTDPPTPVFPNAARVKP